MKNVEHMFLNTINKASKLLMIVLLALVSYDAHADIINPSATVTGGYLPGSTSTIVVDVSFDSNTSESADLIEVRLVSPISGLTLAHGELSPSPYIGCGLGQGDEVSITGPAWAKTNALSGNSQCGAFDVGTHSFGIDVTSTDAVSGNFDIQVRILGDGLGAAGASEEIITVSVLQMSCMIVCPDDMFEEAPNNSCSLQLNVGPPTLIGMCTAVPDPVSDNFPVGTTAVVYETMDINGAVISCVTLVTITDDEDPFVSIGADPTYDLLAGECTYTIPQNFAVTENCEDPEIVITQNDDITTFEPGVNCPGGPTKYLRVYDTNTLGINTELNIDEVTFAVAEAFGSTSVTVNVYTLDGPLLYSNMELVGSGNDVLTNIQNELYTVSVSAVIDAGETFVVEVVVPDAQFNGVLLGMNNSGQSATSYISTDFCGSPEPTAVADFNNGAFADYGSIIIVEGFQSSYVIRPVGNTALIGDEAPVGNTPVTYEAIDASGNSTTISFTVQVNAFNDAITAIVCNDEVQISLDNECMEVITADLILEGGPYGCFDDYTVEIEDQNGVSYGNVVTGANIGQDLTVRVTGPNSNSCWGKLIVEDKAPAPLDCIDVTTTCFGEVYPGAPIADRVTFPANISNGEISDGAPSVNTYNFSVNGLVKSTITGVSVRLNIEHTSVSDLSATLTAPDGTSTVLFIQPGFGCAIPNLQFTLADDAFNTYDDLLTACGDMSPGISGNYQPNQLFSIYDGKDPNGDWTITISDVAAGNGGTVIAAELVISQTGGIVSFPTTSDIMVQTEGGNVYTVLGIDGCGSTNMSYNDNELDQDCSSPYSNVIQRTWSAVDASGNVSNSCVQTIYVYRNGLATLMFPPNYDDIQEPSLSCDLYGVDAPGTDITGVPNGDLCDNVQIFPYTDTKIDVCKGSYKLIRHFRLLEWCSGEVVEHNQIIKVLDTEGPVMEDIPDVTVSAGEFECEADHVFVYPVVVSDCSDLFTYRLSYLSAYNVDGPPTDVMYFDDNTSYTANAAIVRGISFGRTWVKWEITDECGNVTTEYLTITVEDQVNPIAVCDEFTVVSIGSDGYVNVFATSFDDGSLDNCGILEMKARKMTNTCVGINTSFSDEVRFCCDEVGETIMVAFEVTDLSGNKNTCMVEVTVQDKLPPYITLCPADVTLNCQADYTDLTMTGEPEYIDNCEVVDVDFVDDPTLDNCGAGTVRRTWTVIDKEGFKATCIQIITLEDEDPFEEGDIDWPNDYDATTCDTDLQPDNLPIANAYPRYDDDNCSLVATVYEDKVFIFVDGACEKILREWTVIDWCTYNESAPVEGEGYYKHLQVIKLKNTEAPEIQNCGDIAVNVFGDCEGPVEFTLEATDDCTPFDEIVYSYQVDLFDDGSYNLDGTTSSISTILPTGTHSVRWTVEDKCGNVSTCDMSIVVRDGKKPTPYCLSSITTVVMNNNGMIEIWASEFDLGSYDNCTDQSDLLLSFSQNTSDTNRVLTCDHLPNGVEEEIQLELWITDEAGNQDYCSITLILQDSNADVCGGGSEIFANISGTLRTEDFDNVEGVSVTAVNPSLEVYESANTNDNGTYNITQLPKGNGYKVIAQKNDDVTNGVSTLDLVLIQRHILGLQELDSPYKLIASDVNNDGLIKASDLLSLRKVILGVKTQFPNGQMSWRFIPKNTTFADATDPFPFNEEINVGDLQFSSLNNDMMSIKIGDVNGSAATSLIAEAQSEKRADKNMTFVIEDAKAESGLVSIPVYAEGIKSMVGYQFTMNLDNAEYVSVEAGQLEVSDDNFGIIGSELTTSWSSANAVSINTTEPLFTITLDVNEATRISELISINSEGVSAEAYDNSLNTYNVSLETRSGDLEEGDFALFQNRPNPFLESTQIKFFLPEATDVELIITDVTGRLVTKKIQNYPAGTQNILINYSDLNTSGVLYYTIKAGEYKATKKMISIR